MNPLAKNDEIIELEHEILDAVDAGEAILLDYEVEHCFKGGMYARTIYIPKGMIITGRLHYVDHINFLMEGKLQVTIGKETQIISAPAIIPADGGFKKAAVALENSMWVSVHTTETTDVDAAEEELMEPVPEYISKAMDSAIKLNKYDITPLIKAEEKLKCLESL